MSGDCAANLARTWGQMWGRRRMGLASVLISNSPQNMTGGSSTPMQPMRKPPRMPQRSGAWCS